MQPFGLFNFVCIFINENGPRTTHLIIEQMSRTELPSSVKDDNTFRATSAPLLVASFLIEQKCKEANDKFMSCRHRHEDPSQCLIHATAVLDCVSHLFTVLRQSSCQRLYERFWRCLDINNQDHIYCRPEEFDFYACTKEHLGVGKRLWKADRPEKGFKEEGERPELGNWRFAWHVWSHKNNV